MKPPTAEELEEIFGNQKPFKGEPCGVWFWVGDLQCMKKGGDWWYHDWSELRKALEDK